MVDLDPAARFRNELLRARDRSALILLEFKSFPVINPRD